MCVVFHGVSVCMCMRESLALVVALCPDHQSMPGMFTCICGIGFWDIENVARTRQNYLESIRTGVGRPQ